ncbi:MAG: BamA/TamA family outer membrane protein [Bacteriovoracia bacterium]
MRKYLLHYITIFSCLFSGAQVYAESRVKTLTINQIQYVGLSNFTPRDFDGVVPINIGDEVSIGSELQMVERIQKTLGEFYIKRGFHNMKAKVEYVSLSEPNTIRLLVRIEEGAPCLIRSFEIDDPQNFSSKSSLERFKRKMKKETGIRVGERYDEVSVLDKMRALREWLQSENYVIANTDKVRLTFNKNHTEVDVVAVVEYGERVTFGYQGNTLFSKGELNEFISTLKTAGLGKNYKTIIQRKFEEEYRAIAYNNVKITIHELEKENNLHIVFIFDEGKRSYLQEVVWDGLSSENVRLAKELFEQNRSRLLERGFYVEKDLEKTIELVIEGFKAKGFLSAKLISKSATSTDDKTKVTIHMLEGEESFIGKIELEGFSHFTTDQIKEKLSIKEDSPLNPFTLEEGIQNLSRLYYAEGFLDFRIITAEDAVVDFLDNNRVVNIRLSVEEGQRYRVGNIRILGLQKTRYYVAEREVVAKTGDWWLESAVSETESNLRRLGLFGEINIRPEPSSLGGEYRDFVVQLIESEPGIIEAGPGFRSDLGARLFGRITYSNINGRNWIGSFSAQANRRVNNQYRFPEYLLDANFVEPRFFGTRNVYTIGVSTKKQRFPPDFNAVSTQFYTGFERKIVKSVTAKLYYKIERIRQFDVYVNGILSPQDNQSMLIGSVTPQLIFDTREHPLVATKGQITTLSLEYADPAFSGQTDSEPGSIGYQRWSGSTHVYVPVTKNITWSNVVSGGFARSNIADRAIPLIKLFRLGGYNTIRGFAEDTINVDTTSIKGSLTFVNIRTQIELPFIGDLRLAPFLDAGNLFIDNAFRGYPFLRAGAGAGLHYMTPVGPINLDLGFKLNQIGNESPSQFHFSVGLI